ncbi:Ca2+-binding EF-hand superfamily protein [Novosphingobium sp. PhB165]|uniref:EF-hand domain-containing protein n=1 Tax=Novosphingobium sp. PhB165 TaxID=2485105 RepID=UPI0010469718|nr:hypothetical protein [Novosphingobium sp. PhB165]TCM20520.1 Ca2+-binding EF-hand superfamily protein [Novosphingobium sp. PhB165]
MTPVKNLSAPAWGVCILLLCSPVPVLAQGGGRADAAFANADLNKDGRISRNEYIKARSQRFTNMDRNGDGGVSKADFPRASHNPAMESKLNAFIAESDTNHDGMVTRAELDASPPRAFNRADTNHDGFVDKAELAAIEARRRR